MSALERFLLVLVAVIFLVAVARGADQAPPVRSTVQQAPPVRSGCNCAVTGICTCGSSCDCPLCFDYSACRARAVATRQPLVVWVGGYLCATCLAELKKSYPNAVHCYVPNPDARPDRADWTTFTKYGAVIADTDSYGRFGMVQQFGSGATGPEMVGAVVRFHAPVLQAQPAYQPAVQMFAPMPATACST